MAITSTSARTLSSPRRWVEPAARAGYATKGVLYGLIGALALAAVSGNGGTVGGTEEAQRTIADQPFGQVLLGLIGAGMFALAAWRFVQAIRDPEGATRRAPKTGVLKRIGWVAGGIAHGAVGVAAFQLALGDPSSSGSEREWVSKVLAWQPVGPILIGIAGAALVLFALSQIYAAWTTDFTRHLRITEMTASQRRWATRIGRLGLFSRGVVFTIIGAGLVQAALNVSPGETRDVGGALRELGAQPYGAVLLGIIAAGLLAYGVYGLVEARFRRIPSVSV